MSNDIPRTSVTAVISLVFGIISWCGLFFIGGIVAVVTGHVARSDIRRAPAGSVEGDGLALAGLILGYLNILIAGLALLVFMAIFGVAIFAAN